MKHTLAIVLLTACALATAADEVQIKDPLLEKAMELYQQRVKTADDLLERAKKKHADDVDAARKFLIGSYDEAIKRATRRGDLEPANLLLKKKKELEEGGAADGSGIVPTGSVEGTLYVCGDDSFDLRINGQPVASGGVKPEKIDLRVKAGDVITAKVSNAQYERGFMLFFLSKDKKVAFFSNTKTWKSFKPDNPLKWWEVTGKTASEPAAAGQKNYLKIEESAGFGPDAIWGNDGGQSYLLHVVDRQDVSK